MDRNPICTFAEYSADLQRRNRNYYGADQLTSLDTKVENNSTWDQRSWGRDGGRGKDQPR